MPGIIAIIIKSIYMLLFMLFSNKVNKEHLHSEKNVEMIPYINLRRIAREMLAATIGGILCWVE